MKRYLSSPFRVQAVPQLFEPEPNQSAPFFLLELGEKGGGWGISSIQFLTCTKIKTHVPSHLKLPKIDNGVCQAEFLLESIAQLFPRTLFLLRNPLPRACSLLLLKASPP